MCSRIHGNGWWKIKDVHQHLDRKKSSSCFTKKREDHFFGWTNYGDSFWNCREIILVEYLKKSKTSPYKDNVSLFGQSEVELQGKRFRLVHRKSFAITSSGRRIDGYMFQDVWHHPTQQILLLHISSMVCHEFL